MIEVQILRKSRCHHPWIFSQENSFIMYIVHIVCTYLIFQQNHLIANKEWKIYIENLNSYISDGLSWVINPAYDGPHTHSMQVNFPIFVIGKYVCKDLQQVRESQI